MKKGRSLILHILWISLLALTVVGVHCFTSRRYPAKVLARRQYQIRKWFEELNRFSIEKGGVPETLYDLCQATEVLLYTKPGSLSSETELEEEEIINDCARFFAEVEYGLFASKQGWLIAELDPRGVRSYRLVIDQNGNVYMMRSISKKLSKEEVR